MNPDLPILDELGAEFEALASGELGSSATPVAGHQRARLAPTPPRRRRRRSHRVARRAAIVLVLICLVGGVALAARFGASGAPEHTAPGRLGTAAGGAWKLSAYRDRGRLCLLFVPAAGELTSACGPAPGAARVRATSAVAGGVRYVFGATGAEVASLGVRVIAGDAGYSAAGGTDAGSGPLSARVPARRPASAAIESGFPAGSRWFVAAFPAHGVARQAPATVFAMAAGSAHASSPYVDCSLGVVGRACARKIAAEARGGTGR